MGYDYRDRDPLPGLRRKLTGDRARRTTNATRRRSRLSSAPTYVPGRRYERYNGLIYGIIDYWKTGTTSDRVFIVLAIALSLAAIRAWTI